MCTESAYEMARVLGIFEERFGYRNMDVETLQLLPSAALILIFAAVSTPEESDVNSNIHVHLNTFFRALDALSNMHVLARAQLDNLVQIREQWYRLYNRKAEKRKNGVASAGSADKRSKQLK
jgi:hypothetical protein